MPSGIGTTLSWTFSHKTSLRSISFPASFGFHPVALSEMQDILKLFPTTALDPEGVTSRSVKMLGARLPTILVYSDTTEKC